MVTELIQQYGSVAFSTLLLVLVVASMIMIAYIESTKRYRKSNVDMREEYYKKELDKRDQEILQLQTQLNHQSGYMQKLVRQKDQLIKEQGVVHGIYCTTEKSRRDSRKEQKVVA